MPQRPSTAARTGSSFRLLAGLCLLGLACAGGAGAQPVGLYEGLTDQGQFVQLQVSASPSGGRPVLSFLQVVYDLGCLSSGRHSLDGYAVSARVRFDTQGAFNRRLFTGRFFGQMQARYDGVQAFHGSTSLYGAQLLPSLPLVAEECQAVDVQFTATRSSAAARAALDTTGLDRLTTGFWATDGQLLRAREQSLR